MRYILLVLLLFSCISDDIKGRLYTIRSGDHESTPRKLGFFTGDVLRFKAKFDSTAIYNLDSSDQEDWNKVFGFSDCGDQHHKSSARIGWKWADNRLQFGAYTYANGVRTMEYITDGQIGAWISCSIEKWPGKYLICVDGVCTEAPRGCSRGYSYWLNPYFGGNMTIDHDIFIWVD